MGTLTAKAAKKAKTGAAAAALSDSDDDDGAARAGVGDEGESVAGVARNGEEGEALAHGAAVRRQAGDLEPGESGVEVAAREEFVETHQWPWPPVAGTLAMP